VLLIGATGACGREAGDTDVEEIPTPEGIPHAVLVAVRLAG